MRNLYHAGKGGGKTHTMGVHAALFVTNCPNVIGLIAANTYGQLTDSTLLEIFQVWKKYFGWTEYTKDNPAGVFVIDKAPPPHFKKHGYTFKTNHNKIFFRGGQVVQTVSLENYKALDGRTIGWALLDETKDTREEAVKDVIISRLRQIGIYVVDNDQSYFPFAGEDAPFPKIRQANPLFIYTAPAKEQWLTDYFHLEEYREEILNKIFDPNDLFCVHDGNRCVVIASTYHNAQNLPADYIDNLLGDLSTDQADMQVFGSPFGKTGGEYYTDFKKSTHVKPCAYIPGLPVHLAVDFNVHPYMTGIVWQIIPAKDNNRIKVQAIEEFCLPNPRNTVEDLCKAFDGAYGGAAANGFFYYGDATGKNKIPLKESKSYFNVLQKHLIHLIHQNSRRLLKQNPRHRQFGKGTLGRRDFMNKCLRGKYGFDIEIDPGCKNLIADYEFIKENPNGGKLKVIAEINGIRCEKYGHTSDASDNFFAFIWGDWAREVV